MLPATLRELPAFRWFWAGRTVSALGSAVTTLALPLAAILTLHASPLRVGLLGAVGTAAPLLLALPAGIWVDRVRRRPLLIAVSVGSGAALLTVPVAAWSGRLFVPQLYTVAFVAAALAVVDRIACWSYLPAVVPAGRLVEANSVLSASSSAAQVAGPGLGGVLVQVLSAPGAIVADAISFLLAAGSLVFIRSPETRPARRPSGLRADIGEGVRFVAGHPMLRPLAATVSTFNLFDGVLFAVYLLYMSRDLGLSAAVIGLVLGLGGVGGLLAALVVGPITRRTGSGRAIIIGFVVASGGEMLIAGAAGPPLLAVAVLLAAEGLVELGTSLYAINAASLKAAITPEEVRGRVAATNELLSNGMATAGWLLGGVLGQSIGLRPTVVIAGLGTLLCLPWAILSPVRVLHATGPEAWPPAVAEQVGEPVRPGAN